MLARNYRTGPDKTKHSIKPRTVARGQSGIQFEFPSSQPEEEIYVHPTEAA